MATRRGLNCTLSYMRSGKRRAYQVRANLLTHGMTIIYDESASRTRRAFYPHRLSSAQFALGIELIGDAEHTSFTNWLASYADYVLDTNLRFGEFPSMAVSVPSRNFLKKGVPLSGYDWNDAVGKMLWTPQIVFETAEEPGDRAVPLSKVGGLLALTDREMRYFYPTGNQLAGQAAPPDGTYSKPVDAESLAALTQANNGTDSDGGRDTRGGQMKGA